MTNNPACPVCARPYSPNEANCPACGWQLQGGYELIPDTADVQLRYERDLAQARLAYRERQFQQAQAQLAAQAARDQVRIDALEATLSREREETQAQLATVVAELRREREEAQSQMVALATELRHEQAQSRSQVATFLDELRREREHDRELLTNAITKATRTGDQVSNPSSLFDIYIPYAIDALWFITEKSQAPKNKSIIYNGDLTAIWSHDGTRLLVANRFGVIVCDPPAPIPRSMGFSNISCVALAPDGQSCAVASSGVASVRLWRIADCTLLHTLTTKAEVSHLAFAPDGQHLAIVAQNSVELWHVAQDRFLQIWTTNSTSDLGSNAFAFSPDGLHYAVTIAQEVEVRRVADGTLLYTLNSSLDPMAIAFAPDGRVITVVDRRHVMLWHIADGTLLHELDIKFSGSLVNIAFAPDGQLLSVATDYHVCLWRIADGMQLATLGYRALNFIAFTLNGQCLIMANSDELILWSVNEKCVLSRRRVEKPFNSALAPDEKHLAIVSPRRVEVRRIGDWQLLHTWP
ncbi:MAG: hypothetical protein EI684_09275 [Candidatus Viridilinea halotolerans]|uniref:WD40 repeat domain-containing protein n=1 Tax=Candidatus Viridilinea halotolerans TaxID=2491704 RepID=A0A426U1B5_9CHLR|nr:MAG: hypothetical protein EI684_09275 [Candidatus Viridilinea halotolerans]